MAVLLVLRGLAPLTRTSLPAWPRAQGAKILHAIRGRRIAIPAGRVNTPFPLVCPARRASHLAGSPRRVPLLPHLPRTSRPSSSAPYVVSCASLARSMTRQDKTRTATPRARSSKSITLSPDPSGSSDPRQGSLRSRRHPDHARCTRSFRAVGSPRAVACLRTLST